MSADNPGQAERFKRYLNVADVLRNLPQVGISGLSSSNSNFSTAGGGINSINLRNLGDNRTLVLVNGRRMVSGYTSSTTNVVDINMIPTDFIERVDIITGGASAVYGSEAIAGVVNFILKDHFEGKAWIELSGEITTYELAPGQSMLVHPGHVGLFEDRVSFSVTRLSGIKNIAFAGDGYHLVSLTGPGTIWLQSMPLPILAHSLEPYLRGDHQSDAAATGAVGGLLGGVIGRNI